MMRRGTPEADLQRTVVQALRIALPRTAIIHHCANEVTEAGPRGAKRQAILVGMGVHAGFADLMVLFEGRVLFLELKAPKGRLRPEQEAFREAVEPTYQDGGMAEAVVKRSAPGEAVWVGGRAERLA